MKKIRWFVDFLTGQLDSGMWILLFGKIQKITNNLDLF